MSEMPSTVPPPVNYQRKVMDVLKAIAVSSTTISTGDLAWAINYQRVSRPIEDVLAEIRPLLEDHKWPPLTCLVLSPTQQPILEADRTTDARLQQRGCWAWAIDQASERQRLRGVWLENSAKEATGE